MTNNEIDTLRPWDIVSYKDHGLQPRTAVLNKYMISHRTLPSDYGGNDSVGLWEANLEHRATASDVMESANKISRRSLDLRVGDVESFCESVREFFDNLSMFFERSDITPRNT